MKHTCVLIGSENMCAVYRHLLWGLLRNTRLARGIKVMLAVGLQHACDRTVAHTAFQHYFVNEYFSDLGKLNLKEFEIMRQCPRRLILHLQK